MSNIVYMSASSHQSPISVLLANPNLQASTNLCQLRGRCVSGGAGPYCAAVPRMAASTLPLAGGGEVARVKLVPGSRAVTGRPQLAEYPARSSTVISPPAACSTASIEGSQRFHNHKRDPYWSLLLIESTC